MFYREAPPSPQLGKIVFSFWELIVRTDRAEPITHEVFPDGFVILLYYRNRKFSLQRLLVAELAHKTKKVPVYDGDLYWGVRISPAICRELLGANVDLSQTVPAQIIPNFAALVPELLNDLNKCENFDEAIRVFEDLGRRFENLPVDEKIAEAVRFIEEKRAQTRVAEIAAAIGLSVRQFERRFLRSAGLTPKQFLRARRLRATAADLVINADSNWAQRAAEFGFSDQAHLTHEFTTVTERSPASFAETVSRIEHGLIIK